MPKQIRRPAPKRSLGQRLTNKGFELLSATLDRLDPQRKKTPKKPAKTGAGGQSAFDTAIEHQNRRPGLRQR